jgi:hypothetical protein
VHYPVLSSNERLEGIFVGVMGELSEIMLPDPKADTGGQISLADIVRRRVDGVATATAFPNAPERIACYDYWFGVRINQADEHGPIMVLRSVVERATDEQLRAILLHEAFHAINAEWFGPQDSEVGEDDVDEYMRFKGLEREADLVKEIRVAFSPRGKGAAR